MRERGMHFISLETMNQIEEAVKRYASREGGLTPDAFFERLTDLLPVEKMDFDTVRRRVEGYYHASELMWEKLLASGRVERQELVRRANIKSLSQYHYLTGSREPARMLLTRDDLLNDPTTALVKLRDDILGLAGVMPEILQEPSAAG